MNTASRLVVALIFLYIGGCTATIDIPPEEFIQRYNAERPWDSYHEYQGIKSGRHILHYYDLGTYSYPIHQKTYRSPVDQMPMGFPVKPQLPKFQPKQDDSGLLPPEDKN